GGTPDPVPAASVFSAEQIARAQEYSTWARVWSWSSLALSLLVACLLGLTRWGPRLAARLPGWWWVRVVLAVVAVSLIGRLVTLPFAVALRKHALANGLSDQPWSGFAADLARNQLVQVV